VTRVVYVAGTGRSGSTLVAQLLERRAAAVHVGELRYVWERGVGANHLCECGRPFRECPFWTAVLARAYGDDGSATAARIAALAPRADRIRHAVTSLVRVPPDLRSALDEYRALLAPLYDAVAAEAGVDVVIDSSKDPSYLYVVGALGLDLATLHLVRDPRAVAYSWTRTRVRPEIHWQVEYMRTIAPRRAARNWLVYHAAIEAFTRRHPPSTRLRYEDLVRSTESSVAAVGTALGLPERSPGGEVSGHSISGNPIRFGSGTVTVRADDEWRSALPTADRRLVTAITAPLLRHHGYSLRGTA
jgi:hypothetical protein